MRNQRRNKEQKKAAASEGCFPAQRSSWKEKNMERILSAGQISRADAETIADGMPAMVLMERAALGGGGGCGSFRLGDRENSGSLWNRK